jgi:rhodanese-related sulfurtransferase
MTKHFASTFVIAFASAMSLTPTFATTPDPDGDGNRYLYTRYYASEISAAEAYLEISRPDERKSKPGQPPILLDVRSLEEYAAGHPEKSYNVPYPRICSGCDSQDDAFFYWEVYDLVKGDTDRLIMTLCRTGARSVRAGNILANPAEFGIAGPAFTNVRNIWEGFVGQPKYAYDSGTVLLDADGNPIPLDLNANGVIDDDSADVFEERKDANGDKDGWRNFQNLPWTTKIVRKRAYLQDPWQYELLNLTPVE